MQAVTTFSGSTVQSANKNTIDWTLVSDGQIYKATLGNDYTSAKGFLVSMTRFANSNGFKVDRYVNEDGSVVEFRLTYMATDSPTEDEITADSCTLLA